MEVRNVIARPGRFILLLLLLVVALPLCAQKPRYLLRGGQMQIELPVRITEAQLEQFIGQYNLKQIGLHQWRHTGKFDSLEALQWQVAKGAQGMIVLRKPLEGFNLESHIKDLLQEATKLESTQNVTYGRNRFRDPEPVITKDTIVTFILRGFEKARKVMLAGSFNAWDPSRVAMALTDSGWRVTLALAMGKHYYKYIVDDKWITDPANDVRENDGEGNINSVLFVTNARFVLNGHPDARRVYVAGSFNNWKEKELSMQKINGVWYLPLFLGEGTHSYKFIVDGKWLRDPNNSEMLPDGHGDFNSVLRNGIPKKFRLDGFTDAQRVFLTGNFNGWRNDELQLVRSGNGWALDHTLPSGNYTYHFIVDGKRMPDPANPLTVRQGFGTTNSYLIINPNYTFVLKGFDLARSVRLTGDFTAWDEKGLPMKREGATWSIPVHLTPGKHLYKFIVDDQWIIDPGNKLWEQNEFGTGNSIVWMK
jgi:hypothetical protein